MKRSSVLQAEAMQFFALARLVQDDKVDQEIRTDRLYALRIAYLTWYREALALMAAHGRRDLQATFTKEYKGPWLRPKIEYFLRYGALPYSMRGKFKAAPDWTANTDRGFNQPLTEQINLLAALGE